MELVREGTRNPPMPEKVLSAKKKQEVLLFDFLSIMILYHVSAAFGIYKKNMGLTQGFWNE